MRASFLLNHLFEGLSEGGHIPKYGALGLPFACRRGAVQPVTGLVSPSVISTYLARSSTSFAKTSRYENRGT